MRVVTRTSNIIQTNKIIKLDGKCTNDDDKIVGVIKIIKYTLVDVDFYEIVFV